jgi:hypothetical protein
MNSQDVYLPRILYAFLYPFKIHARSMHNLDFITPALISVQYK